MKRHFKELLEAKWAEGKFVCVGLDTDLDKLPQVIYTSGRTFTGMLTTFNRAIIEATKDIVLGYKLNIAFYVEHDEEGWRALKRTIQCIHDLAPNAPVILDIKTDIDNTNRGYVRMAFDELGVDAVTVNPYLGGPEALKPFLDREDKGIIVLCRTSNPGAREFQDLIVNVPAEEFDKIYQGQPTTTENFSMPGQMPLWEYVAHRVHGVWNRQSHNCSVVVGATYPDELAQVRRIVGDMPILIPGIDTQGGDVKKTVKAGVDNRGLGMIIAPSRSIIFASSGRDYAEAARLATIELHTLITAHLPQKAIDARSNV